MVFFLSVLVMVPFYSQIFKDMVTNFLRIVYKITMNVNNL